MEKDNFLIQKFSCTHTLKNETRTDDPQVMELVVEMWREDLLPRCYITVTDMKSGTTNYIWGFEHVADP